MTNSELAKLAEGAITTSQLEQDFAPIRQAIASLPHRIRMDELKLKKSEMRNELINAHVALDQLGVARGDAFGYWDLPRRIRELAEHGADIQRELHRAAHGEE